MSASITVFEQYNTYIASFCLEIVALHDNIDPN